MSKKQLSLVWTKTLNPEDVEKLISQAHEDYLIIRRLKEIIAEDIENLRKKALSETAFDKPAWSEYQAYLNGQQKALIDLQTLLTLRD